MVVCTAHDIGAAMSPVGRTPVIRISQCQHIRHEFLHLGFAEIEVHFCRVIVRPAQPSGKRFRRQTLLINNRDKRRSVRVGRRAMASDRVTAPARRQSKRLALVRES